MVDADLVLASEERGARHSAHGQMPFLADAMFPRRSFPDDGESILFWLFMVSAPLVCRLSAPIVVPRTVS